MSLLNDVLRDLDKQNAARRQAGHLPAGLTGQALPVGSRMKIWWWPAIGILVICLVIFGWLSWQRGQFVEAQLADPNKPALSDASRSQESDVNQESSQPERYALTDSSIATDSVSLPEDTVSLPEDTVSLPEIAEPQHQENLDSGTVVEEIPAPREEQVRNSTNDSMVSLDEGTLNVTQSKAEPVAQKTALMTDTVPPGKLERAPKPVPLKSISKREVTTTESTPFDPVENSVDHPQEPSSVATQPAKAVSQAAPAIQPSQNPSALAARRLREARDLYQKGKTLEAEDMLRRQLDKTPEMDESLYQLGAWFLARGGIQEALTLLNQVNESSGAALREIKAHALVSSGRETEAMLLLDSNPPNAREFPRYQSLRAGLLQQAGQYEEALKLYAELVDTDPRRGDWWAGLAIALDQTGRVDSALRAYQQALSDPTLTGQLSVYARQRIEQLHRYIGSHATGS
ncbi:hypothetical protein BTA51_23740 [Hahella sp. CCB-MM4]|uniref:tetratricopeptide repeat protein n=1 Tax=Hahella sp. (strain CCB-MM4) TaxID=1926491 RepID=UPI000B9C138C|nr:tetratricopeptide repeat protein [Hahella sp. CCB-MM4]OZG70854.1 hypothetical protein BTA51_23740 [Hahella sp. CCB-MM4]